MNFLRSPHNRPARGRVPRLMQPPNRRNTQRGQTTTEFAAVAVMMLSVISILFLFLAVFTEYGWRILKLIGLEYP